MCASFPRVILYLLRLFLLSFAGLRAEDPGLPKEEDLAGMSIAQLKAHLNKYSISSRDCVERRWDFTPLFLSP